LTCFNCIQYRHREKICLIYSKTPPASLAGKCRYYDRDPEKEKKEEQQACPLCPRYIRDDIGHWCVNYDHPEYEYEFIRIHDLNSCIRENI